MFEERIEIELPDIIARKQLGRVQRGHCDRNGNEQAYMGPIDLPDAIADAHGPHDSALLAKHPAKGDGAGHPTGLYRIRTKVWSHATLFQNCQRRWQRPCPQQHGKIIGFFIGFAGVVVLMGPDAFRATGVVGETTGRLACLAAAACYAVSSVLMRRIPPADPIGLSAVTLWIGAVIVTVAALWSEGLPSWPVASVVAVIITLGLIQTALANILRIVVIRSAGPTFMSLTNYMVPIWSVVLGVVFLGEPGQQVGLGVFDWIELAKRKRVSIHDRISWAQRA